MISKTILLVNTYVTQHLNTYLKIEPSRTTHLSYLQVSSTPRLKLSNFRHSQKRHHSPNCHQLCSLIHTSHNTTNSKVTQPIYHLSYSQVSMVLHGSNSSNAKTTKADNNSPNGNNSTACPAIVIHTRHLESALQGMGPSVSDMERAKFQAM